MPAEVTQLGGGQCRVSTPHGVKAKNTSCGNAKKQARLLNAVDHGWKPTGKPASESIRTIATQLVSQLLEVMPAIRPFDHSDWQSYGGAEGTPFIASVTVDGLEGDAIADANGVQVHLLHPTEGSISYALTTPFAQGKAMLPQIARATTSGQLAQMGLEKI